MDLPLGTVRGQREKEKVIRKVRESEGSDSVKSPGPFSRQALFIRTSASFAGQLCYFKPLFFSGRALLYIYIYIKLKYIKIEKKFINYFK